MNNEQLRQLDPILARFDRDIAGALFRARYDPTADVLTVVFDRPDSPLTSHDRAEGVYLDFDPVHARISALTIVNYRSRFMLRHASGRRPAPLSRLWLKLMLLLDRLSLRVGRYWDRYASGQHIRQALEDYHSALRRQPEPLANLVHAPASA